MAVNWDYYNKYEDLIHKYMPLQGEGKTMASQIVTAVNKLIYKWYNDGDVFDNTHYMQGWLNDLSSYANWLETYADGAEKILREIKTTVSNSEYEDLLYDLARLCLDEKYLAKYNKPKVGSIYKCDGEYRFEEEDDEDEDDDEFY